MVSSDSPGVSVLFVCLGNICRSTMAEGVFRSFLSQNPQYASKISHIDSAGTGAYHTGDSPDPRTMSTLRSHGVTSYSHAARKIRSTDFSQFDFIFGMDASNLRDLQRAQVKAEAGSGAAAKKAKVCLFGEYSGKQARGKGSVGAEQVGDPYYGGDEGFEQVYQQVLRFSKNFLEKEVGE